MATPKKAKSGAASDGKKEALKSNITKRAEDKKDAVTANVAKAKKTVAKATAKK